MESKRWGFAPRSHPKIVLGFLIVHSFEDTASLDRRKPVRNPRKIAKRRCHGVRDFVLQREIFGFPNNGFMVDVIA